MTNTAHDDADAALRLRAASESRPYKMQSVLAIRQPVAAPLNVQSVTPFEEGYLVLHHGSVIQRYWSAHRVTEVPLQSGDLDHPNDCQIISGQLWVVDTGRSVPDVTPTIKVVDLKRMEVLRTFDLVLPGWRVAALSAASPGRLWLVAVQAVPKEARESIRLLVFDPERERIEHSFTVGTDQYYVQGCAWSSELLNVVINNGRSPVSKIIRIDPSTERVTEEIVAPSIGELEGLNCDRGPRPALVSATNRELLRIVL